jgi:hypothetical protein
MQESKLSWRQRLADKIRPDEPDAAVNTPAVVVPPVVDKARSKVIPKWMRDVAAGRGADTDGQVLNPTTEQRGTAGWLSSISPRSRDS